MEVRFDPSAKLAFWWTLRFAGEPFLWHCTPLPQWGLDVMSESHCTYPIRGLLIRPKHKKTIGRLVLFLPHGYFMRPNKAKTAIHGFHYPGDMAVRMRKVLARPWVGIRVSFFIFNTKSPARSRTQTTRSGVECTNHEATAPLTFLAI